MKRIVLYTKDIQVFTGKSEKVSRKMINTIRTHFNKPDPVPITIYDFCDYMKIDVALLKDSLK